MNKNIAIEFEGVGKQYRLGLVGTGSLQHDINRWWQTTVMRREDPYLRVGDVNDRATKGNSDYVWALKDISFKVEKGDVVGIIGKNGAGKSTLLKLLSHITAPSTGHIRYRGRIASLLEVGTGFVGDLTARQNIYMNGSIMGMSKREITAKLDEIVDFAGIERYLDTPVKRFSSGMYVRLGFAVAAHLEPEILVVDEVLAVGDAEFQKKAIGKMQDVSKGQGRTVLFVSHNMAAVRNLCNNGVVLKDGMIDYIGTADDCVNHYLDTNITEFSKSTKITPNDSRRVNTSYLTRYIDIIEAEMLNDNTEMATDEPICIDVKIHRNISTMTMVQIVVGISNDEDIRIINYVTQEIKLLDNKDDYIVHLKLSGHGLPKGKYSVLLATGKKDYAFDSKSYDHVERVLAFKIIYTQKKKRLAYCSWDKSWASIVHANEGIECMVE